MKIVFNRISSRGRLLGVLLILFFIPTNAYSQCQYLIDSLNTILPKEKSHFKRAKILMALSEEWKERDKNISDNYIKEQNIAAVKITDPAEKADFGILLSYIAGNTNDTVEMRNQLIRVKDYILSSGNEFLVGKYWACEGNYLRMNHQETEENHKKIEEILNRSINILSKHDPVELSRPYHVLSVFLANEKGDPVKLYKTLNDWYKVIERIKQPRLSAKNYAQLGVIYFSSLRKPAEGLKCHIKALNNYLISKDSVNIGGMMINIGSHSYPYGDKEKNKNMILQGMNISLRNLELNPGKLNKNISNAYADLADIYEDEKQIVKQFDAYRKAIYYNKLSGRDYDEPLLVGNFGIQYSERGIHDTAFMLQKKALELRRKFGNKEGVLFSYGTLAQMALENKNYDTSIVYANKSLDLGNKIRIHTYDHISYKVLYLSYKALNNFELSNFYMDRFYTFMDSVRKTRSEKEVASIISAQKETALNAEFERKEALSNLELERNKLLIDRNKKDLLLLDQENNIKAYNLEKSKTSLHQRALELESNKKTIDVLNIDKKLKGVESKRKEEAIKQQRKIIYGVCFGGAIVLVLLFFVLSGYNQKKKANEIIMSQKQEVENQKHLIEEKQKEIIDSITYAKRIQYTLLAHDQFLKSNLDKHFVLFKPKDIVSGDFYWATKKVIRTQSAVGGGQVTERELFYLAVCDSTGHGVPGAFMSLLNISFLNEAINEKNIIEPHEILNHVRNQLVENISKDGGQDGMDAILLCIETPVGAKNNAKKISYSAANNCPIIIRQNKIIALEADKMPVGKGEKTDSFTLRTIDLQEGDSLYLYTDGYPDQFGGPKGKKFKYKQLNDLLISISSLSLIEQKNELEKTFTDWKGSLEQVDDVCFIGIKI